MEPEGSLPHSQASATCPYPGPAQSSPHTHIPPPGDPMFPLETLPPGDPSGGVVYLRIVLSPEEASCLQVFLNMNVLQGGVVSTSPNPQAGDHRLSAVHDCLFNLFAATLHIGGRSSIRNLRARHAVVTGTHYTRMG